MNVPPFLPEHVPGPAPVATPKRGLRVLALWVALIVMFLTIWQFLTPSERPNPRQQPLPPCEPVATSFWSSNLVGVVGIFFVLVVFVVLLRRMQAPAKFARQEEVGLMAFAERRFGDAITLLRGVDTESKPVYRAAVAFDVALAELWAGNVDAALAGLVETERVSGGIGKAAASNLRFLSASYLAFVYALAGDVTAAERWASESKSRLAAGHGGRLQGAALSALSEATLASRRGDAASAIARFEAHWLYLRQGLDANAMRMAEVLRAFAEAQGALRAQNVVGERLVRVEPVAPGEFRFLGAKWPEMNAFLAAHGLS